VNGFADGWNKNRKNVRLCVVLLRDCYEVPGPPPLSAAGMCGHHLLGSVGTVPAHRLENALRPHKVISKFNVTDTLFYTAVQKVKDLSARRTYDTKVFKILIRNNYAKHIKINK
jgi:hypothetical protein